MYYVGSDLHRKRSSPCMPGPDGKLVRAIACGSSDRACAAICREEPSPRPARGRPPIPPASHGVPVEGGKRHVRLPGVYWPGVGYNRVKGDSNG